MSTETNAPFNGSHAQGTLLLKQQRSIDTINYVDPSLFKAIYIVWSKVWGVLGPVGNGTQCLYNVNGRFHLMIRRAWYWLTNATAYWNASFAFETNEQQDSLPEVLTQIVRDLRGEPGFQVLRNSQESKIIRANGILFEFNINSDVLHVQISDQTVSFRESQKIINTQLMPIVERIEKAIPDAKKRYALTARFGADENPFLAVYLRRIDQKLITSFQCSYHLDVGQDEVTVSVNLDSVNLVADSRERFREASVKLLALSRP